MKNLVNFLFVALMSAFFISTSVAAADGLPVPWPFPWAKDCPVEWQSMAGRYLLSDTKDLQYIDLKITVISKEGFKLVRIARYNQNADLLFEGFTLVSGNQRTLRLTLMPTDRTLPSIWAVIKLHYQSDEIGCAADHLVPILTLEPNDPKNHQITRYKLVRVSK